MVDKKFFTKICDMPNKNSLEIVLKGAVIYNRNNWHDVNLLATTGSDIGLWPRIKYTKHEAS